MSPVCPSVTVDAYFTRNPALGLRCGCRCPVGGPDWVREIKHDGYRLMARRGPGRRFERLRATEKAVDPARWRGPAAASQLKPQGSYVRARVSQPRLQIGRFRRCSLPALQQ
jgi:hypothetical protein